MADAAYNSKWEVILDQRVRRGLVLVIQRSQKYCTISMGGLLILSLESFTNVSYIRLISNYKSFTQKCIQFQVTRMVMSILTLFMSTKE